MAHSSIRFKWIPMQLQRSEKRRDVNISRALQWGPGSTACHKVGCPSQPKVYEIYLLPKVYKYIFTPICSWHPFTQWGKESYRVCCSRSRLLGGLLLQAFCGHQVNLDQCLSWSKLSIRDLLQVWEHHPRVWPLVQLPFNSLYGKTYISSWIWI